MDNRGQQGVKRNHHFVPRAYLRGFAAPSDTTRVYVYQKGKPYLPGLLPKNNPHLCPLKTAGMIRDFYAIPQPDGTTEYEHIENRLEQSEKAIDKNRVFHSLDRQIMPNATDRHLLAEYIFLTIKRVPYHRDKTKARIPNTIDQFGQPQSLELLYEHFLRHLVPDLPSDLDLHDQDFGPIKETLQTMIREGLFTIRDADPSIFLNQHMLTTSPEATETIKAMQWRFLVAGQDHQFVTSDNPVYFLDEAGLAGDNSYFLFPTSSRVCLYASRLPDATEQFMDADKDVVRMVNERTASRAKGFLYSSIDSEELVELLNDPPSSLPPMPF